MLLEYRDAQFWKRLREDHWLPRVPTVFKKPFKKFPFSETGLLRALKSFEQAMRSNDPRVSCLVSLGDSEVAPRRPLKKLFSQPAESFSELEGNLSKLFPGKRFGLMTSHLQAFDSEIWDGLTAFLQDARHTIDFPVPRAFLDLFYGNYKSQFTGLHKDTQEIFAFVIRGRKRILTWPFESLLTRVKGLTPADQFFHKRLEVDYRKFRKDAVVLEAEAGDLFYWPSDRWHVAEPVDKNFSALLSMGLVRQDFSGSPSPLRKRLTAPGPLKSEDLSGLLSPKDPATQLSWVSAFGFEMGGPLSPRKTKTPAAKFRKKEGALILWTTANPKKVMVATNGYTLSLPTSERLLTLLKQLGSGKAVEVPKPASERKLLHWLARTGSVQPVMR